MTTQPKPTPTLAQARAWLQANGWTFQGKSTVSPIWHCWKKGSTEIDVPASETRRGWFDSLRQAAADIAEDEGRFCDCGAEILAEMAAMEVAP